MAYSYVRYTGNGSTTNYTFSFPTISTDHIKVRVNGALVTNWSFLNASTVQFAAAPASGAIIEIRRETPKESAIVNFTDGSVLLERDLDLLATYDLYLAQETKDGLDSSITQTSTGVFDAQSRRITNLATPTSAQDAVTKAYADTIIDQTIGYANSAASSASSAQASATSATASAVQTSADKATTQSLVAQLQSGIRDRFEPGVNFTANTTTTLTLTSTPAKQEAVFVFFNGVCMQRTDYTLVGNSLVFVEVIPNVDVEVVYYTAQSLVGLSQNDLVQLGNAIIAANSAAASATLAAGAKTGAESARDAAILGAPTVYVSTSAGITGTVNGQYFSVPSATTSEYLILYRNVSGVATEIRRYPSKGALDPLQRKNSSVFAVEDIDGNLGVNIQTPFDVDKFGGIGTTAMRQAASPSKWAWGVADKDGNIILGVNYSGQLVADLSLAPTGGYKTGGTYDYEVNHFFGYGQSLSVGQATPAISTTQKYDNVMFTRGMRPQYDYPAESDSQWYAAFVPSVEAQSPTTATLAETPMTGAGDMIKERILAEDGLSYSSMKYQIALSTPGYGGQTISQLSKGSSHYARLLNQATYGRNIANSAAKSYAVQAVAWTQGESDYVSNTPRSTYTAALNTLVSDINTDIKAITGQIKNIPFISYQVASHKVYGQTTPSIALAHVDTADANPLVYIATPMYHFDYAGDSDAHLTSVSSRWLGAYYGLAYKRIIIDGKSWKPLKPLSSVTQGTVLVVKFNVPSGRLEFDTTNVTQNTNYGFELVDSIGNALAISSVSIMGPDTVKIVAGATIPFGAKLRYAWTGSGNVGATKGPRGNLRDTQGNYIVFDPNGLNKPMHNWCVIFEIGV